jgi:hypothetical protein
MTPEEQQEKEIDLRVREKLCHEREASFHQLQRWTMRVAVGLALGLWAFVLLDELVCCEARRIARQELHK